MATRPVKYATAVTIPFSMVKRDVMDLAVSADWTPATGDCKISIDGGAFANTTNLPAIISGTDWGLALTTGETTGKVMTIQIIDSATKVVEDQKLYLTTKGHASAYEPFDTFTAMSGQAVASVSGNVAGSVAVVTTVSDKTGYSLSNPSGFKKNTAFTTYTFPMFNSTTGALQAGLTVTAQRSLDTAAFATCANAVAEISAGFYKINLAAADMNADLVVLLFTATGCKPCIDRILTEP